MGLDHSRSYKKRAWVRAIPMFWPVVTSFVVGAIYICGWIIDVNGYAAAIAQNKASVADMQDNVKKVPVVEQKVDSLKERVDDIAMFLGVPERKHRR